MKESVIIKSNTHSLSLHLDPDIPFEDLVRDICAKFAASRTFFGESEFVLETVGREVNPEEAAVIVEAIELNSDITVTLIQENNELRDVRTLGKVDKFYTDNSLDNAKIVKRSITGEEQILSDSSIIILGDVKSHAVVKARGNVIVMGQLDGTVIAGAPDNSGCFIVANNLNSTRLSIGGVIGAPYISEKWSKRRGRDYAEAFAVTTYGGRLIAEPLSSGLLRTRKDV